MNELRDMMFQMESVGLDQLEGCTFLISARVTESLTSKTSSDSQKMLITHDRLKVKILDNTPSSYKPEMNFTAYVSITLYSIDLLIPPSTDGSKI